VFLRRFEVGFRGVSRGFEVFEEVDIVFVSQRSLLTRNSFLPFSRRTLSGYLLC
jgi:hypothetical protein